MEDKQKRHSSHRHFSSDFKLSVLTDYRSSNMSKYAICRKYGIYQQSLDDWLTLYSQESLSLPKEIIQKISSLKKKKDPVSPQTEEEKLRAEVSRLQEALKYSELRVEGLTELLKIGKEEFGLDLLKKGGAEQ